MRPILALLALFGPLPGHLGSGDDVQPRDTVSVIESVVPALPDGVRVDVVGGDTFLRVRSAGHTTEVVGYDNEKFITIKPDGSVLIDRGSTTWVISMNRYGNVSTPSTTDAAAGASASRFTPAGSNGTAMWHDHRIHWMSPSTPQVIDAGGTVLHWKVPVVVDGTVHTVNGTLYLRDKATFAWWLLALPAAGIALLLSLRNRTRWFSWMCWVSAFVTWVGFMQWRDMPPGARITPLLMLFGLAALVASNIAMSVSNRGPKNPDNPADPVNREHAARNQWMAASLAAGAGACMITVAFMTWAQVRAAYVPMLGPDVLARAVVPVMVGTAVVAAIDGVMRVVRVEPAAAGSTD